MLTSFARMPDPTVHANSWKMLQTGQKLAKENAETNGWNVTEETKAVTDQFCAAVKTP